MQRIGVGPGWRCLEIGGGGGSVARWLCEQVGPSGHVVATDLDTRFLQELPYPNLQVRKHNIEQDDLPEGEFDLVHTRIVIVHLRERELAIKKLTRAVKPGGWVLLEEPDHLTTCADPEGTPDAQTLFNKVMATYLKAFRNRGQDMHIGNRLFGILRAAGFESLGAEGRARVFQGSSPETEFHRLTYRQLRELILASGEVSGGEFDRFMALLDDAGFAFRFFLVMSTWGRKPVPREGTR
jgi:SAM-dependent methyltransferase